MLSRELDLPLEVIEYYTDSKVVLGYLSNEHRRFYVDVCNRVSRIRKSSSPSQWNYVATHDNPADQGTRGLLPEQLCGSLWLQGPNFLRENNEKECKKQFSLIDPEQDNERRPRITAMKTTSTTPTLDTALFSRFGSWMSLVRALIFIKSKLRARTEAATEISRRDAELLIMKEVQRQCYQKELMALHANRPLPRDSSILTLSPYL
ncbi:uncharacterized protein LOC130047023 [Ostrea edulis]|uniref:uncharacterized protein LOC130047023 n=1 Tax=Ostrea edulis TaxID=37623 RepID=UPI0024AED357|nr:uncharacterized protein LOC130047023 [Ostrea edulis]